MESAPAATAKSNRSSARTKSITPLYLPFWDDFSTTAKPYPDTAHWVNSYTVWVNDGMGINTPTLNVATFDGLDSAKLPYNPNDILLNGFTDSLVSRKIDLSSTDPVKGVPVALRNTVYLSFFYQWQGNGEAPDAKDYLQLEFKNDQNKWEAVLVIQSDVSTDPTVFYHKIVPIGDAKFFHAGFQFRLRSFGRLSGPYDTWNVDYVYLNKNRNASDLYFPDRAISTKLTSLFGPFRAMPRQHFNANPQLTQPKLEIQNLIDQPVSINFRTDGFFSNSDYLPDDTVTTTYTKTLSFKTPINITNNVLIAGEHKTIRLDTLPQVSDPLQFHPDADSILVRLTIALQTKDNVPKNNVAPVEPDSTGDYTPKYKPLDFRVNDTVRANYVLSNYYAYDDGVAEYSAGLIQTGNLAAYRFEKNPSIPDEANYLEGFYVYFPDYGITSNQTVDFFVYDDKNGLPGNILIRRSSYNVRKKGINNFQLVQIEPLFVSDNVFYVGWQHPVEGKLLVGLDLSNDTSDKIFVNTNGSWYMNEDVKGSLMIRPVFGSGESPITGTDERHTELSVYPNPNPGQFYIAGDYSQLQIIDMHGRAVPFTSEPEEQRTKIHLNQPAGLYLLRYVVGKKAETRKISIR